MSAATRCSQRPAALSRRWCLPLHRQPFVRGPAARAFAQRVVRACARRVAGGDADALAGMTGLAAGLDEAIGQAVTGLRGAGYSWAEIAARLGVSRQAAQQR